MNYPKLISFSFHLLMSMTTILMPPTTAMANAISETNKVFYDKSNNLLSINAKSVSLKSTMKQISIQTGIEVLFDDRAEKKFGMNIKLLPLEKALVNILKGHNYSLQYDNDENGNTILTGIMILPADSKNKGNAKRILDIEREALQRTKSQLSLQQTNDIDLSKQRWQKRLDRMPEKFRKNLEYRIDRKLVAQARRKQEREKNRKAREQKRTQIKEQRESNRNTFLNSMSPEQRVAYDQQLNESREQITQQLLPQLQSR